MKKSMKCLFWIGTAASIIVSIWHFFVPWLYQWAQYIPSEYDNLTVLINWINLFFSFMLLEIGIAVIIQRNQFFAGKTSGIIIYSLLLGIWTFRLIVSIVYPYPMKPVAVLAIMQLIGGLIEFLLLLTPFTAALKIDANSHGRMAH